MIIFFKKIKESVNIIEVNITSSMHTTVLNKQTKNQTLISQKDLDFNDLTSDRKI